MMDVILIVIAVLLGANALIGLVRWLNAEVFKPRKGAKTVKSNKAAPVKAPAKKPAPAAVQEQSPTSAKLPPDPRTEALLHSTEKELRMNLLAQDVFWQMAQISRCQPQPQPKPADRPVETVGETSGCADSASNLNQIVGIVTECHGTRDLVRYESQRPMV